MVFVEKPLVMFGSSNKNHLCLASKSGGKPCIPGPAGGRAREQHPSPAVAALAPTALTHFGQPGLPHLGRLILTTKSRPSNLSSLTGRILPSGNSNPSLVIKIVRIYRRGTFEDSEHRKTRRGRPLDNRPFTE